MTNSQLRWSVPVLLALAGCGEGTGPTGTVAAVVVAPGNESLLVGDTLRLVAAALDENGEAVLNQTIRWATSDASIATVSGGGLVRGVAGGSVYIFAASVIQADSARLEIVAPFTAAQLSLGDQYSCAVSSQGVAHCWGDNFNGTLGVGFVSGSVARPMLVAGGQVWSKVQAGGSFSGNTCGLAGGTAYCWGSNYNGQIGDGTTIHRITPTLVQGAPPMSAIAVGNANACGIVVGGVHCWPSGGYIGGYLGAPSLQSLSFGTSHICGLTASGQAYCWGSNYTGQLGDSTTYTQGQPVPVYGNHAFTALDASNSFNCAVAFNGAAWCWGTNYYGELGDGTLEPRLVPVMVSGGHSFTTIATGGSHACALTAQGNAWCWGYNYSGQLGDGTTVYQTSPVRVAGGLRFSSIAAGSGHTCAIALSGIVYCWGGNPRGQLGDNSYVDRSEPAVVWAP